MIDENSVPDFPPLLHGFHTIDDPYEAAIAAATAGTDAGLVLFRTGDEWLEYAIVLAPDTPIETSEGVLLAIPLGLTDALGALGPPEMPVEIGFLDRIFLNSAKAGSFCFASATTKSGDTPHWVVGFARIRFRDFRAEPGLYPDETALGVEGAGDLEMIPVLNSTLRHTLHWIHQFLEDGLPPLARQFSGLCIEIKNGTALGLNDQGHLLHRIDDAIATRPIITDFR